MTSEKILEKISIVDTPFHCALKHLAAVDIQLDEVAERTLRHTDNVEKKHHVLAKLFYAQNVVCLAFESIIQTFCGRIYFEVQNFSKEDKQILENVIKSVRVARAIIMRLMEEGYIPAWTEVRRAIGDLWEAEKHLCDALNIIMRGENSEKHE